MVLNYLFFSYLKKTGFFIRLPAARTDKKCFPPALVKNKTGGFLHPLRKTPELRAVNWQVSDILKPRGAPFRPVRKAPDLPQRSPLLWQSLFEPPWTPATVPV